MKTYILTLIALLLIAGCSCKSTEAGIEKQTFVYAVKDGDTLRLDKYDIKGVQEPKPCVIFVFGGAFSHGARDEERNVNYMEKLAREGYVAVAIDYRLGFKNFSMSTDADMIQFAGAFVNTVDKAVEDLVDATVFIIGQAGEWGIDPDIIIANGSSAGGIAVLQAAYGIANQLPATAALPSGFKYAGVISFAGAVMEFGGPLGWEGNTTPIMLFHGDADGAVPFDSVDFMGLGGLYGSNHIARQLDKLNVPYYLYNVENAGHVLATDPMENNMDEINLFIRRFVREGRQMTIVSNEIMKVDGPVKKNFSMLDFLQNNFGVR